MNTKQLAYLAAATMGMMAQGLEPPVMPRPKKPETKYDKKKCKSCKHFHKTESDCRCPYSGYVNPMQSACGHYEKRKK
ncbi:MAG: hypothetical protein KBT34_07310 [Prevotella sp.]|nr:hypothetical protein [Candidatus Prevotella equi]